MSEKAFARQDSLSQLADKFDAVKVFWTMRRQFKFRGEVFARLVRAQVVAAQPEAAFCDVVDFAFESYVCRVTVSSFVFCEFFKRELFFFSQTDTFTDFLTGKFCLKI
jgi:hypothetical protein